MNKIPIIILNYNSSADCRKCISYLKLQEGVETEIVVVDNLSPRPGEQEAVRQLCLEQGCTFIQAPANRGYNAGNNIGLRYAASKGYKYALIANPDMEFPQRDYVRKMAEAMDGRPEVAVCGSDIVEYGGKRMNPLRRDGDWHESLGWVKHILLKPFVHQTKSPALDFTHSGYCQKVVGCCLMVRMGFIEKNGFFDEGVFLYCEEAILCRQVERAGKKMYYLADVQSIHQHIKSTKGNPLRHFDAWEKSRKYFIRHYNDEPFLCKQFELLSTSVFTALLRLKNKWQVAKRKWGK